MKPPLSSPVPLPLAGAGTESDGVELSTLPAVLEQRLQTPLARCAGPLEPDDAPFARARARLDDVVACHLRSGGRRLRARLAWQAAHALALDARTGTALACCCEWLHNASLIHDDIQDGDVERRGVPALWAVVGVGPAICAGDALISAAYGVLREACVPPARLTVLLEWVECAVAQTIAGQLADLVARQTAVTRPAAREAEARAVSEASEASEAYEAYEVIATQKSGPLLGLPLALAVLAGGAADDSRALATHAAAAMARLGVAYQLLDDLADWPTDQRHDGRHLPNAVLIAMRHQASDAAQAWVARRARHVLADAEARAVALPVALRPLVGGLAGRIRSALDAG